MLKNTLRLYKVSICNLFGFNEIRYTKDKSKRARYFALGGVWCFVILMLEFYLILSQVMYAGIGLGNIIPVYCFTLASLFTLMFTLFKASSVIFQMNTYEMLISLPMPKSAIVVSRFLYLYTSNMGLTLMIMLPGMLIYGIWMKPGVAFYLFYLVGIIVAPLLPTTIATTFAMVIKAISIRVKHRNVIESVLSLVMTGGFFVWMMSKNESGGLELSEANVDLTKIAAASEELAEKVGGLFPPAVWFSEAVQTGHVLPLCILVGVNVLTFAALVIILNSCFTNICIALNTFRAKRNYQKVVGNSSSMMVTLLKREFRYLITHSAYMANSVIGAMMMIVMSVAMVLLGTDKLQAQMPIEGMIQKMLPFALAMCCAMVNITSCSISLEGKTHWIARSLPIPVKMQYDAKILVQILISVPCYLIAATILAVGLSITGMDLVWLLVIPFAYILFIVNFGIRANLWFPIFDWENEIRVIKQSASVTIAIFGGIFAVLIPALVSVALPYGILRNIVMAAIAMVVLAGGCGLYLVNMNEEV